jgi:hypothetical protein
VFCSGSSVYVMARLADFWYYSPSLARLASDSGSKKLGVRLLMTGQAAVAWEAGQPLTIEDIEVAAPKANEVRIEIYYTGVCHTGTATTTLRQ